MPNGSAGKPGRGLAALVAADLGNPRLGPGDDGYRARTWPGGSDDGCDNGHQIIDQRALRGNAVLGRLAATGTWPASVGLADQSCSILR